MAEGQTATNPQTGERVVLRGGQWVPLGGGQAMPRQQRQAYTPRYTGPMPTSADALFPSLVAQESGGRAGVRGPMTQYGQALGRTQVLPSTARGIAQNLGIPYREDLLTGTSPEAAAYQDRLGRAYLQEGFAKTGNARDALMYYHGGPDRSLWGPKTQRYADEVLMRASQGGGVAPVDNSPMQASQPAIQTATNPQTGEKVQLIDGQWQPMQQAMEVTIDTPGIRILGGKTQIYDAATGTYQDATPEQIAEYEANQRRSQADRQARVERMADPQYQAAMADAQRGSANVPDQLRALGLGGTLGFLTDINATAQGALQGLENAGRNVAGQPIEYSAAMAAQAARDSERDAQARFAAENPIQNFALQTAGGFLAPGLAAGGNYIRGARLAEVAQPVAGQVGRAAQVGAAYGALSGIGYGQGNLIERAPDAVMGGIVGAGTGAIGQSAVNRLTRGAANAAPSQARLLSREGVSLTPGQMVSEVPVVGNVLRSLEEGASSIPFVGGPIAGARQQSVETFNKAAINRVLEPIGERLPSRVRAGYDAVDEAQRRVSQAYDRALSGVELIPDQKMYDGLGRAINDAVENSGVTGGRRVANQISERVFRVLGDYADNPISGQQFKALESEFTNLAANALESSDGATRAVGRAYQGVNDALRTALREQNPQAAESLRSANSAYARLMRVERAAASSVSQANDGVFSPTQLGQAVAQSGGRRANARGDALMQDLAVAGRNIIPSRVGDSGTATRGAVTGLVAGAASGVPLAGTVAIPVIATSIAYSRPAQAALNAVYRATDSRAASEAVQELARLAQRNPALVPYYEGAVQHVLGRAPTNTPAAPQAQPSAQAPSAALQRVMQ